MIKVENMTFGFPEKELYDKVSFEIERGEKCALIGSNGTGKTTLVDMLIDPDEYLFLGKIKKDKVERIGYVSQLLQRDKQREITVYDYLAETFLQKQQEMEAVCAKMVEEPENMEIFDEYQVLMDAFDAIDGYNYDSNIHKQLKLAGMSYATDLMLDTLSGGEYKLIQIIREMMQIPDLLIMDEPDVFLDFENLNGLVKLAKSYMGTLLVITHNRYLLYHCFNKILHLENADIQEFAGTYAEYNLALMEAKVEMTEQAYKDQAEIDRLNAVVNRMRAVATAVDSAQKGRELKAKVSYLGRLMERRTKAPFVDVPQPKITLPKLEEPVNQDVTAEASGDEAVAVARMDSDSPILQVENYGITFDEVLLDQVSFALGRKEKIAIVGPNGTGKTTLLRAIYQRNEAGITLAEDAKVGFLSQLYGDMLDEKKTVYEVFEDHGLETRAEAESYLEDYYFEGDGLDKMVGVLSGGEKNLLQLAIIGLSDANVLLLDEPTSHLDTYAQVAMETAIQQYQGAVLMVSHDFYTIANCADTVLYVEDRSIRRMSGRAFRKMIYKKYFDKDYLELDQKKKQMEMRVIQLLQDADFKKASTVLEQYETVVRQM